MKLLESSLKSNFDFDTPLKHCTELELDISQQCAATSIKSSVGAAGIELVDKQVVSIFGGRSTHYSES